MTTYSTVVATRNRAAALALSLPLQLAQSRLPEQILVVDSSDDPTPNQDLMARLRPTTRVALRHIVAPAGSSLQRNIGLAQVDSDVTFFPDDDSLVHPGTMDALMQVYDRDADGRIGGVGGHGVARAPEGVLSAQAPYAMRRSDRLKARVASQRLRAEEWLFPDPIKLIAHQMMRRLPAAEPWLADQQVTRVEFITGYRMSFRTEAIRKVRFNEFLGRYALLEDADACLGVLGGGLALVTAHTAPIYHHKSPERRTNGHQFGMMHVLNRAYIACRTGFVDDRLRGSIKRHARFKIMQYSLGAASPFERERLAGAKAAARLLDRLLDAAPATLDATYLSLRAACEPTAQRAEEPRKAILTS
ncbi:glycosyltransferase family 2 protein [Rubellimicrobium aerolatum]|uniref:Glycosyltransferase family 2 protein n=1 Tax=Rubellimicrobium aerolatum TaxID=490979 RepID=A0ABW0SAK1_9RHOB|nr:glycosyltransferase [Rubellimicrobium aerolatum]MBP1806083.1 hypothetical protein [Rubellimicrobium aerolatum]